jgi:hypothetical protein
MRRWFFVTFLTFCTSSFAFALGWDVSLPGARARLGFGGGFFVGAWSVLKLEVSGTGAYQVHLDSQSGRYRDGFKPLKASLTIPEGSGVRVQTLHIPLSNHVAKLTLTGEAGSKTVTLEPFDAAMAISITDGVAGARGNSFELSSEDLPANPALLLGVPEVVTGNNLVSPAPLLAALAAGSRVFVPESQILPKLSGAIGLGRLERDPESSRLPATVNLEALARSVVPAVDVPPGRHTFLGWWAVGGFLVGLGVYSARRTDRSFVIGAAGAMFVFGLVGFWAFAPQKSFTQNTAQLLIGARGWGLKMMVISRFDLQASNVALPKGAKSLTGESLEYLADRVNLKSLAWQKHSYLLPPVVSAVSLRVVNQRIENIGNQNFSEIQVVGSGVQEPVLPGSSAKISRNGYSSQFNFEALPLGSVVGKVNDVQAKFVIALPEDTQ